MMKNIYLAIVSVLLTMAVASCTDYPEDWGFEVQFGAFDFTPSNVSPAGYDANLWATVQIDMEGEGISEYGFEVDGNYIQGTAQRNGDNVTITGLATGLSYDNRYPVSVIVKSKNASVKMSNNYIHLSKDQLAAHTQNCYMRMIDDHQLRVVAFFTLAKASVLPDVTMKLGGLEQKAVVAGDSAVAVIDLAQIDVAAVSTIDVLVSNPYGQATTTINFNDFKSRNTPKYVTLNALSVDLENGVATVGGSFTYNASGIDVVEPEVQFTFMNQTKKATKYYESKENDGSYYAYYNATYNLYDFPVGTYGGVIMSYKNIFIGSDSQANSNVGVTLSACVTNSNDGDKGSYYQIDGVKWAKYDMSYSASAGGLTVGENNTNTYYSFGNYANTTTSVSTFWSSSVNPFTEYTTSGEFNVQNTGRDVVAANMAGWKLPMRSDFERLYNNTSIVAHVNNNRYATECHFAPSKNNKRFIITGNVYRDYSSANVLTFISRNVQRYYKSGSSWKSSYDYTDNITYMTSEFRNVYNGNSIIYAAQLWSTTASFLELSFNNNLHVRPIKSN